MTLQFASAGGPAAVARSLLLALALVPAAATISAQTLLEGPAGAVTAEDVESATLRLPKAAREATLARPGAVRRQADEVYQRRALAAEARRNGLDQDPAVAAQVRLAVERVLSDAQLEKLDAAAAPADADVARFARDLYRENPERFRMPEQTKASHILVPRGAEGRGRERAEALREQLKAGASFEKLAREQSADAASAAKGGDLGWFAAGTMVPEFEQAVAALKNPGDLSEVVETRFGFHIARLDGRRPAGVRSFDEVREELERDVRAKVQRDARQQKVGELMQGVKPDAAAIEALARKYQQP